MKPIEIPALDPEQLTALKDPYRSTRQAQLRTRAQEMVLLAAQRRMSADRRDRASK